MEIYQAIAKEWYWLVIWGAIVSMAFCPTFLKSRCPSCRRRCMKTVDVEQDVREQLMEQEKRAYLSFYRCDKCGARQLRELTGPYEDASDSKWSVAFRMRPDSTKTLELIDS